MARTSELDLVRGTLDVLVLKSVQDNPQHGYAVAAWIRRVTDAALTIEDGALYTALHRMEKRGWLASTWGVSENNRRAKYYRITPHGDTAILLVWAAATVTRAPPSVKVNPQYPTTGYIQPLHIV